MTVIQRLQLDDKDPVRVNSAINQLAEFDDRMGTPREVLSASRNYYVGTNGSDTNDGRTVASAWLTFAHAMTVITGQIDFGSHTVTLNGVPSFSAFTTPLNLAHWAGGGIFVFDGAGGSIASTADSILNASPLAGSVVIQNVTLSSVNGSAINMQGPGTYMTGPGVVYGTCGLAHIFAGTGGAVFGASSSYTISGGASLHYFVQNGAQIQIGPNAMTITLTGTPAFSIFAFARQGGQLFSSGTAAGVIFSGSASAGTKKYESDNFAIINTSSSGINYYPGGVAGTTNGGLYQ